MRLFSKIREKLFTLRAVVWARLYFLSWKCKTFKTNNRTNRQVEAILHINTEDNIGGASRVAMDLLSMQRKAGYKSYLLAKIKETESPYSFKIVEIKSRKQHFLEFAEKHLQWQDFFRLSSISLLNHELLKEADIVHLHNLHGGYFSYLALPFISNNKKVVWSIHDMHPITGHCAHSFDCNKWKTGCGNCPDLNTYPQLKKDTTAFIRKSKEISYKKSELHIVALSQWMKTIIEKSILKNKNIHVIYNGINTSIFRPKPNKAEIRARFNIDKEQIIVLFSSNLGSSNPYKGGAYLNRLVKEYENNDSIIFLAAGNSKQIEHTSKNLLSLPYITDQNEMADIYNLADIYLYPTLADNCPLAVLESMGCGTPVLTFNTGGTPELVIHKETGYVAEYKNYNDLKNGFEWMFNSREIRHELGQKAIDRVQKYFTIEHMNEQYLKLYNTIANN